MKERAQSYDNHRSELQSRNASLERELQGTNERLAEATVRLRSSQTEIATLKAKEEAPQQREKDVQAIQVELKQAVEKMQNAEAMAAKQEEGLRTLIARFKSRETLVSGPESSERMLLSDAIRPSIV